ncbi:MAG: hypothetical protein R2752_19360 [Vicinamibacterales bacterium]
MTGPVIMLQDVLVALAAVAAGAVIVRRLLAAWRPSGDSPCDACALHQGDERR